MAQIIKIHALKLDIDNRMALNELVNDLATLRTAFIATEAAVTANKAAMASYTTPASVALVTSNVQK